DIDVRSAQAALVTMQRSPAFKAVPTDPNAPILPDLDIDIGRLTVARMVLAQPVTGAVHILKIDGATHIAERRAQVTASVSALAGRGIAA
ncbi:hypothetical protein JND48_14900, partial [Listeria monocytogenes]|nr:hypothetical protein [Listeria monocytogenes]